MRPEVPPGTKPLEIKLRRAKIPDYYVSIPGSLERMVTQVSEEKVFPTPTQLEGQVKYYISRPRGLDKMVTQVPEESVFPTPTQVEGQVRIVASAPEKKVVPKSTKKEVVPKPTERKMTLVPPKKKDNPKISKQLSKQNKTKENKKKDKVMKDDPKQQKISNLFKPKLKTTSNIVDKKSSTTNIYKKDNNFEDDLTSEDNFGCPTGYKSHEKRKNSNPQTPDKPERQDLEKFPECSNTITITKKNAPDLAVTGLAGNQLFSTISNQHLAGESLRPNDSQDQVETSYHPGCGSDSVSLT